MRRSIWLENLAADQQVIDHTDAFFGNEVSCGWPASLREIKDALLESANEGVVLEPADVPPAATAAWSGRSGPRSPASSASATRRCRTSPTRP